MNTEFESIRLRPMKTVCGVVLVLALAGTPVLAQPVGYLPVSRGQCFPLDELTPTDRTVALEWLQGVMDREGLYTIGADIKPISSGIRTFSYKVAQPDLAEIEQARRISSAFRCGEGLTAHVQLFAMESQGQRFAEVIFVNRYALDRLLGNKKEFFAPLGLSPGAPPLQVLGVVEHLPREDRYRGLGYLFGFPDYAVDFFVKATVPGAETGKGKDRDFYAVPVYRDGGNYFVWAVPLGHTERAEDKAIAQRAAPILADYRARREKMTTEKTSIIDLVRTLLCDNTGACTAKR